MDEDTHKIAEILGKLVFFLFECTEFCPECSLLKNQNHAIWDIEISLRTFSDSVKGGSRHPSMNIRLHDAVSLCNFFIPLMDELCVDDK